jgi:F-type H+-transporting ATPase subunit gamma
LGAREAGNLAAVRGRMRSVKSIAKITKSMKTVASAKKRVVERNLKQARGAIKGTEAIFTSFAPQGDLPAGKKHLMVAFTSDRGLCGGVNSSIGRAIRKLSKSWDANANDLMVLGDKGVAAMKRDLSPFIRRTFHGVGRAVPTFQQCAILADAILTWPFDRVTLVFNKFKTSLAYDQTFLPMPGIKALLEADDTISAELAKYEIETPSGKVDTLYQYHFAVLLKWILLESSASEISARMAAMDTATNNARDMFQRLTIKYNRTRQAVITTELIEIISGAEALKG